MNAGESSVQARRRGYRRLNGNETADTRLGWRIATLVALAIGIVALVLGAVAIGWFKNGFHTPSIWVGDLNATNTTTHTLNVTGMANITDASVGQLWVDLLDGTTALFENLTVNMHALISNAWVDMLTVNMTTQGIYTHTTDAEAVSSHNLQYIDFVPVETSASVLLPFEPASLGDLPATPVSFGNGLEVLETLGPISVVDNGGEKYLQIGEPEPVFLPGGGGPGGNVEPIFNSQTGSFDLRFDAATIPTANTEILLVDLNILVSSEPNFDFLRVFVNGNQVAAFSGAGPDAGNPFVQHIVNDLPIRANEPVTVSFIKDVVWHAGFDYIQVQAQNLRYFTGHATVSLPADLTPFIGKMMKICNSDGTRNVLDASATGQTWDNAGLWPVIRFDTGASDCCVQFQVVSATKFELISRGDQCTTFCASTELKHCIDPTRPEETNLLHGAYQTLTEGPTVRFAPYIQINMLKNPPTICQYRGSLHYPRDRNVLDCNGNANNCDACQEVLHATFSETTLTNLVCASNLDNGCCNVYTIQPDGKSLFVSQTSRKCFAVGLGNTQVLVKVPELPPLIPRDYGTLTDQGAYDPVYVSRQAADYPLYTLGNTNQGAATQLLKFGKQGATGILDKIIDPGLVYETDVVKVFTTVDASEPLTTLRTAEWHHVPGSHAIVTVSGFTGAWNVMNGDHLVSFANSYFDQYTNEEAETYQIGLFVDWSPDPENRTRNQDVTIWFDSFGLPTNLTTGLAEFTGNPKVTVKIGPLNGNSTYGEMMSAIIGWQHTAFTFETHCWPAVWPDTLAPSISTNFPSFQYIQDWTILQDRLNADNIYISNPNNIFNVLNMGDWNRPNSGIYNNIVRQAFPFPFERQEYRTQNIYQNTRFDVRPDKDPLDINNRYWYNIARENYLIDVMVPYFRCTGNTRIGFPYDTLGLFYSGVPGCDTFEGVLHPFGIRPPFGYNIFTAEAPTQFGGFDYNTLTEEQFVRLEERFFIGRINTSFTGGKNIAYVRVEYESLQDPFGFVRSPDLIPPGLENSPRGNRETFSKVFSTYFQYLTNDLGCEDIIFDIRNNLGGAVDVLFAFRESVGGSDDDPYQQTLRQAKDWGENSPFLDILNYETPVTDFIEAVRNQEKIYGSLSDEYYGIGSVITGGKAIILQNSPAASSGDIFPNFFLGPNLDKELGNDTQAKFVGAAEMMATGGQCVFYSTALSEQGSRLFYPFTRGFVSNDPITAWLSIVDCGSTTLRINGDSYGSRPPYMAMDCTPMLQGKSGGCPLPEDLETLIYPDLGYMPNDRPRLPGDTRPQTPDPMVREEWRDAWLEECVREACVAKKKKRDVKPITFTNKPYYQPKARLYTRTIKEIYGRDNLDCPEGVNLTLASEMTPTTIFYVENPRNVLPDDEPLDLKEAREGVFGILHQEMSSGGLCMQNNQIYATPSCRQFPAMVRVDSLPSGTLTKKTITKRQK